MNYRDESLESLLKRYFTIPCNIFSTRGMQDGIVVKFNKSYLKIYDDIDSSYRILGFEYNEQLPSFEKIIQQNELQSFCDSINNSINT